MALRSSLKKKQGTRPITPRINGHTRNRSDQLDQKPKASTNAKAPIRPLHRPAKSLGTNFNNLTEKLNLRKSLYSSTRNNTPKTSE